MSSARNLDLIVKVTAFHWSEFQWTRQRKHVQCFICNTKVFLSSNTQSTFIMLSTHGRCWQHRFLICGMGEPKIFLSCIFIFFVHITGNIDLWCLVIFSWNFLMPYSWFKIVFIYELYKTLHLITCLPVSALHLLLIFQHFSIVILIQMITECLQCMLSMPIQDFLLYYYIESLL